VILLARGSEVMFGIELLRYSNSKTTEIYTHVTYKGFDQVKSPLENLDVSTRSITFGDVTRHKVLDTRRIMTLKTSNISTHFPQMILTTTIAFDRTHRTKTNGIYVQ
jgi:hypothetical protein